MTSVLVTSNCQTAGLAAALQRFFPDYDIAAKGLHELPAEADVALASIKPYDFWVTSGREELAPSLDVTKLIMHPQIGFGAFHPDMCYLYNTETQAGTRFHYNSILATWGYINNLSVEDTAHLFRREVYSALGYLDAWPIHTGIAERYFKYCQLDYKSFMRSVQRSGIFMHTFNHPKASVLIELARQVAAKMGASRDVVAKDIYIPDALDFYTWPVYPEIAEELGLQGSLDWIETKPIPGGVLGYLQVAFGRLQQEELKKESTRFTIGAEHRDLNEHYDLILTPFLRGQF